MLSKASGSLESNNIRQQFLQKIERDFYSYCYKPGVPNPVPGDLGVPAQQTYL